MTHVRAASELERLPWLTDDSPPQTGGHRRLLVGWGLAAALLVAGTAFWLGMNSTQAPSWGELTATVERQATVKLPAPVPAAPVAEVPAPMPRVEPVREPAPVVMPKAQDVRPARDSAPEGRVTKRAAVSNDRPRPTARKPAPVSKRAAAAAAYKPWTSWESTGASGRMVRIGTYSSSLQAKRAWAKLVKVYPGMRRLRAVVTDLPSMRNGQTYYRLQFGTTSQAHSEVLCQRMRTIGQSCVVVDLAGARSRNGNDRQPIRV